MSVAYSISMIVREMIRRKNMLETMAATDMLHCTRHTFATLQLASGTDIYTVSKLLGHTNVKTTQVYAKVVDEKKEKATEAFTLDLPIIE